MYKLIALDMDGTLLNSSKEVTESVRTAIAKAKQKGIKVVLCTGRPLSGVKSYLKLLNLTETGDFVVTYNGALVQEADTERAIFHKTMSATDINRHLEIAQKNEVRNHFLDLEAMYTTDKAISDYTVLDAYLTKSHLNYVTGVQEPREFVKFMYSDHPNLIDQLETQLPPPLLQDFTVIRSQPFFLEVMNKEADKGRGVEALAQHLGITKDEVICVGDAENDRHMIEYAGLGAAMANASDSIKQIADFVTRSNDEDGVAFVIEKYLLG